MVAPISAMCDIAPFPVLISSATVICSLFRPEIAPSDGKRNVRCWLQADIQSAKIDFPCTPESGHSEAHPGLPVLTRLGHLPLSIPAIGSSKFLQDSCQNYVIRVDETVSDGDTIGKNRRAPFPSGVYSKTYSC